MSSGIASLLVALAVTGAQPGGFFADTQPLEYLAARDRVRIQEPRRALQHLERALSRHPRHRPSFLLMVRLRRDLQGETRAVRRVREHLLDHPDTALMLQVFSTVRLDTAGRLALLEWADTAGLEGPGLLVRRLRLLRGRGRAGEVYHRARRGWRRYPESWAVGYAFAGAALEAGKARRAVSVFRELVRRRPGRAAGYRGLARALLRRGRRQRALERYRQYRALVLTAPSWSQFRRDPDAAGP